MRHLIIFLFLSCAILTLLLFSAGHLLAADSPHNDTWTVDNNKKVYCNSCHVLHSSAGPGLTKAVNATLCMTCHNSGSLAADEKPFADTDRANPNLERGWSHSWSGALSGILDPNSAHGLRPAANLTNTSMKNAYTKFNGVTCSTCHQQHSQALDPWDPRFIRPYNGTSHKGPHFQRVVDIANEMCIDCHYYRDTNASSDPASARYQAWDGNKRSHPVNLIFSNVQGETRDVNDITQFNTAPCEPASAGWAAQTDGVGFHRYKLNGGTDTNLTNNIVLDASGKVRCMSCHGVHYTDSDSTTIDRSCVTCDP